jgi:hypothetical protein
MAEDRALERLLDLDGFRAEVGGGYWVKFDVRRVPADARRPQGIAYSLTLHDAGDQRVFGIDNAHVVRLGRGPAGRSRQSADHLHRGETIRPYVYHDAETLLDDFWREVHVILKAAGVQ